MQDLKGCQEKVEEVMRLFALHLGKAVVSELTGERMETLHQGRRQKLPLLAALGGGPYYFLRTLKECGRITVSGMAAELGVTLAAITVLANRLVRTGWVTRSRDKRDRRVVWLALTPVGEALLGRIEAVREEIFMQHFGDLSNQEVAVFSQIMDKVLTKLREKDSGER